MKTILVLMVCVCACMGKDAPPDPLANPRLWGYTFGIDIHFVDKVRYCTVNVEVSQRYLDALRKRDGGVMIPCLVLRKRAPGMFGLPVDPRSFQLKRSTKLAWLEGHVAYQITLPHAFLYSGRIDIQSMAFEMLPVKKIDYLDLSETI